MKTMDGANTKPPRKKVSCDQVAWLRNILNRHEDALRLSISYPSVSRLRDAAKLAAMLEILDVLDLEPADEAATSNIINMVPLKYL